MKVYICLILMFLGIAAGFRCTLVPGKLRQLDAGAGQVYGVTDDDSIFRFSGNDWVQVPGKLMHVSVGPAGVWGVDRQLRIFKFQNGDWVQTTGLLKQMDAGGYKYLGGVNIDERVFCLNQDSTISTGTAVTFVQLDGSVKYYSCGRYGCWGVTSANTIFYRLNVSPNDCKGSAWKQVAGQMVMVEVGTDGSVYGINIIGNVYKREGISSFNPIGTEWSLVDKYGPFKHLSYDEGLLWLINTQGDIFKCKVEDSSC
ncbi:fish-egg lectin-like [Pelobates fuscus]|uniref:fish-egg lectin-like n=1 Tax=Pelobates fuscus TaxID=191477 RepID=UPI002FE4AF13